MSQPNPQSDPASDYSAYGGQPAQDRAAPPPATPPATPAPISQAEIDRLSREGDQSEVAQQQIDAVTGIADDTLPEGVTDWPTPATNKEQDNIPDPSTSQSE